MAREESGSLSVSDVVALLRIVGAPTPVAADDARILEGLCELLRARGVEVGDAPGRPTASAARRAGAARCGTRTGLDDGGSRLCCVIGHAAGRSTRFAFWRHPGDQKFGARELAIVAAMARASPQFGVAHTKLRRDERGRLEGIDALPALDPGRLRTGPRAIVADLSCRQREVLDGFRNGDSEKQVARSLSLSINTVKAHVRHIYERFGVSSRGELLARLLRGDEAEPPDPPGRSAKG